jgi:hypothetical protein
MIFASSGVKVMVSCGCREQYICAKCKIEKYYYEALAAFRRVCSIPKSFSFNQLLYGEVGSYRLFLWLYSNNDVSHVVAIKDGEPTVLGYPNPSVAYYVVASVAHKDEGLLKKALENPSALLPDGIPTELATKLAAIIDRRVDFSEFASEVHKYLNRAESRGELKVHDPELYGYFRSLVATALIVK